MSRRGIEEREARALGEAGSVRSVSIERAPGDGWAVVLRVGMEERVVRSRREDVRTWATLDSAAKWVARIGIAEAVVRIG
ncbi:hypothetical protein [Guyparkeria sp.]|uniref:hypothetical protein n=1 Tax=Guyparkeria sp. TaxID=2035736 RepID=UPI0039705886